MYSMNLIHKSIIPLLVFLFLIGGGVQGQNKKLDSLKIELQNHTSNDTIRADLLYDIAFNSFRSNMDATKLYLKEAEELSNTLNYIKGKARVSYLKGILENIKSNYKESLVFFNRSLQYYESINDLNGVASIQTAFGITHFDLSQYDESLRAYEKAAETYRKLGNQENLIVTLTNSANVYSEIGRYPDAISNYRKALELSKAIDDEEGIAFVEQNLGVVYTVQGNYLLAVENYNKALNYYRKVNNNLSTISSLHNLGNVYKHLKNYNKAIKYYQQSLEMSLKLGDKSMTAVNNRNIGDIYTYKKEYSKALQYYLPSLEISKESGDLRGTASCLNRIGKANLFLNRPSIALQNFMKAKEISERTNNKVILCESFLGITGTYIHEKEYQKAISSVTEAKKISEEQQLLGSQKNVADLLSTIYEETGEYKKAYENHIKFKILSDSLINKENIEKITAIEYEYKYKNELESAERRESTLTKKVKTTTQNLAKSQRNLFLGIIAFLITILALGAIIFFLKLRNIRSKTQNIVIEQKLLRSQMTPHFIFNSLSVLQGMILNKEEQKSVSYLSKFSRLLRIILENSRDKVVTLSQELIAIENYLALQNLANKKYDYTVSVGDNIDKEVFKIPPMLIQPFIENAIEHAFTSQQENRVIDIHLSYVNSDLVCKIVDNGVGVDTLTNSKNQNKKSLSTTITSERLEMLSKDFKMRGSVSVKDRKKYNEKGTIVTLVIPYILQED